MASIRKNNNASVSVIIPCYNHGHYLAKAIESVLIQDLNFIEIIVVDDGSVDNTKDVALSFPNVKYHFQTNQGLSGARNAGIQISHGEFLVFLDADDWLYAGAIKRNVNFLMNHPECAFVSGAHDKIDMYGNIINDGHRSYVEGNHFTNFLVGNYVGMHAAVMYQRWVFDEFKFDTTLKACEDYDLYLRISRRYPVACHEEKIAAYLIHENSMSADYNKMLVNVLKVLNNNKRNLKTEEESDAWRRGCESWTDYYSQKVLQRLGYSLKNEGIWPKLSDAKLLWKCKPQSFIKYFVKKLAFESKARLMKILPQSILRALHQSGLHNGFIPPVGKVDRGDFNRIKPFSNDFGFDRGGAIDRYYIENFLFENRSLIHGKVLEIGDNEYTFRFGAKAVQESDVLHIDATNEKATIIGDITSVPQIPEGKFDCIILTQTLHLIYDFKKALQTCYRILKPGGVLLMTVPGISHIDKGIWKDYWLWSFTDTSIRRVMKDTFNGSSVDIQTYGNVKVASSFLYGMGLVEIDTESLNYRDPQYQVIISVKATKP